MACAVNCCANRSLPVAIPHGNHACRRDRAPCGADYAPDVTFTEPAATPLALLLLGRDSDAAAERGVDCPGELPPASDPQLAERARVALDRLGESRLRARPPLPARRGDPVRRRHGRLVQAGARRRRTPGRRVHRVLRRALHGRVGRHPHRARAGRDPARPRGGLLDGRHGRPPAGGRGLGRAARRGDRRRDRSDHLHEFLRGHQGLHRRARRRGVHVFERRTRADLGLRAGREGAVPARPAPRAQHRRTAAGHRPATSASSTTRTSATAASPCSSCATQG